MLVVSVLDVLGYAAMFMHDRNRVNQLENASPPLSWLGKQGFCNR